MLARADVKFRIAMALETPFHQQGTGLPRERHQIDSPVARDAAHALVHVNAVIKIDEVRQIMNARPAQRAPAAITLAHRLEHGAIRPDLGVTIHASASRGNSGERAGFHGRVTITAINAEAAYMVAVAELDRLLPRDIRLGRIGRTA